VSDPLAEHECDDREGEKQLLRAIAAQVDRNISVLPLFVNSQRDVLTHVLFSEYVGVREDAESFLQRMVPSVPRARSAASPARRVAPGVIHEALLVEQRI
jgi:hypothetical protein